MSNIRATRHEASYNVHTVSFRANKGADDAITNNINNNKIHRFKTNKKLRYHRRNAQRAMSVEILSTAAQL